jgi:hypothetical protein
MVIGQCQPFTASLAVKKLGSEIRRGMPQQHAAGLAQALVAIGIVGDWMIQCWMGYSPFATESAKHHPRDDHVRGVRGHTRQRT